MQLFFKEVYDVSKLLKVVKKYRFAGKNRTMFPSILDFSRNLEIIIILLSNQSAEAGQIICDYAKLPSHSNHKVLGLC